MRMQIYRRDSGLWRKNYIQEMALEDIEEKIAKGGCVIELLDDDPYGKNLPETLLGVSYNCLRSIIIEGN